MIHRSILLAIVLFGGAIGCGGPAGSPGAAFESTRAALPPMEADTAKRSAEGGVMPANFEVRERSIIRRGESVLRVDRVKEAAKQVLAIVKKHNGFVQSSTEQLSMDSPMMNLEARVPVDRFDTVLVELEQVGTLLSRTTGSEDVTMQVVDLEARLKSLKLEEQAYQRILLQAKKIPDVLQVQQRLTEVRGQIESMQAQYKTLREQVAYSTINIVLQQSAAFASEVQDKGWLGETWASAVSALKAGGRATVSALIWLAVMSPFWLVPLLLLWWGVRKLVKMSQPKPRPVPPVIQAVGPKPDDQK